jgi:SAM-dependent methyltransferase
MPEFENVNCAVCGSNAYKVIFKKNKFGDVVKCRKCGLIFRNPRLTQESWIEVLKENTHDNVEAMFYASKLYIFSYILDVLERKYSKKGKIIDVGCGYGAFIKTAKERGWDVSGIEFSQQARKYIKDHLGIDLYDKDLCDLNLPENSFDVVSLLEVIDYFHDPLRTLKEARRILKNDGMIVARLNNGLWHVTLSKLDRLFALFKLYPAVLHLYAYTPNSIEALLKKTGFKNIVIQNSKLTKGDPYKSGGSMGPFMVQLIKTIVYACAQIIYFLSFKKLVVTPTMIIYAKKN